MWSEKVSSENKTAPIERRDGLLFKFKDKNEGQGFTYFVKWRIVKFKVYRVNINHCKGKKSLELSIK